MTKLNLQMYIEFGAECKTRNIKRLQWRKIFNLSKSWHKLVTHNTG